LVADGAKEETTPGLVPQNPPYREVLEDYELIQHEDTDAVLSSQQATDEGMKYSLIPSQTSFTNSLLLLLKWCQCCRRRDGKTFLHIITGSGCRALTPYKTIAKAVWIPLVLIDWRNMSLCLASQAVSTT